MTSTPRDHGGGLDAAAALFGGARADWLDLSTGINPVPYPVPAFSPDAWTALPDNTAMDQLLNAARAFWDVPAGAEIVAAPGASALIARLPYLLPETAQTAYVPMPTYNEHAAALRAAGKAVVTAGSTDADMQVVVHPNNPDGRIWSADDLGSAPLTIIDESFCDVAPAQSLIALTGNPGVVVLKSFGKFWGLAGLRLGFAIAAPETFVSARNNATLSDHLGPWAVSGPALETGALALQDHDWADATRLRLTQDANRLDMVMQRHGANVVGGTSLFRLYEVDSAEDWQTRLARHHIWSRAFPYNPRWLRLGLPGPAGWGRLEQALV